MPAVYRWGATAARGHCASPCTAAAGGRGPPAGCWCGCMCSVHCWCPSFRSDPRCRATLPAPAATSGRATLPAPLRRTCWLYCAFVWSSTRSQLGVWRRPVACAAVPGMQPRRQHCMWSRRCLCGARHGQSGVVRGRACACACAVPHCRAACQGAAAVSGSVGGALCCSPHSTAPGAWLAHGPA